MKVSLGEDCPKDSVSSLSVEQNPMYKLGTTTTDRGFPLIKVTYVIHLLQMIEESPKVSLFADRVE